MGPGAVPESKGEVSGPRVKYCSDSSSHSLLDSRIKSLLE